MNKMKVFLWLLLLVVVWGGLAVAPVQAGCCLVLSVDELPRFITAGEPVTISYRAHFVGHRSQSPYEIGETITAVHTVTKERLEVEATAVPGEPGRYQAVLLFPSGGQWEWQLGYWPMAPLTVQVGPLGSAPVETGRLPLTSLTRLVPAVGLMGLLAAVVGLFYWLQRRTLYRLVFLGLSTVVALGAFAWQAAPGPVLAERETAVPAIASSAMGEALFLAKGCVTCHQHDGVTKMPGSAEVGPDLTHYQGNPDFLREWLRDPRAVRPDTFMPNLGLSDAEIETLVTFLSQIVD